MFTKEIIDDYADKLLIGLSDEENKELLEEFDVIKENMEIISHIEGIENVKPLSFPYDITINSLRDDQNMRNITTDEALANCGDKIEDVVEVPKVVE